MIMMTLLILLLAQPSLQQQQREEQLRTMFISESPIATSIPVEDINPSSDDRIDATKLAMIVIGASVGTVIILIMIGLCLLFIYKKGHLHLPDSCQCTGLDEITNSFDCCWICMACFCYTCMAAGCCKYCRHDDCIKACTGHGVESFCGSFLTFCGYMNECSKQVIRLREEV